MAYSTGAGMFGGANPAFGVGYDTPTQGPSKGFYPSSMGNAYGQHSGAYNQAMPGGQTKSKRELAEEEFKKAYGEAKTANEARYKEGLAGYQGREAKAMETLQGLGEQEKKDISESWAGKAAAGRQDLAARGLSGTTVAPTMEMGYERGKQGDLSRANERLQRERLGYQTGLSGDTLQFMERREDMYPDLDRLYSLLQQYGAGGGEETEQQGPYIMMGGGGGGGSHAKEKSTEGGFRWGAAQDPGLGAKQRTYKNAAEARLGEAKRRAAKARTVGNPIQPTGQAVNVRSPGDIY